MFIFVIYYQFLTNIFLKLRVFLPAISVVELFKLSCEITSRQYYAKYLREDIGILIIVQLEPKVFSQTYFE